MTERRLSVYTEVAKVVLDLKTDLFKNPKNLQESQAGERTKLSLGKNLRSDFFGKEMTHDTCTKLTESPQ